MAAPAAAAEMVTTGVRVMRVWGCKPLPRWQRRMLLGCVFGLGTLAQAAIAVEARADTPAPAAVRTFDINEIVVDGNSVLDVRSIERAILPHVGPGRSFADLDAARAALEEAYHQAGYQTVLVEIPQQRVVAGVIHLSVTEGRIGRLTVSGAQYYDGDAIKAGVPALREGTVPNFTQAQQELAELNGQPGRQIQPVPKPGSAPGEIDVDLVVKDENPLSVAADLNNDHGQDTTALRASATISYADLWNLGHTASLTYVVAPKDRKESELFAASYRAPFPGSGWSLDLSGYISNSNVATLAGATVVGDGGAVSLRAYYQLPDARDVAQTFLIGADYKDFKEKLGYGPDSIGSPVRYWPVTAGYSAAWAIDDWSGSALLSVTMGTRGLGSDSDEFANKRAYARTNFVYAALNYGQTLTLPWDLQLVSRLSGQLADGPLISNEQFALGGASSVRGYLSAEALGDDGMLGAVELRSPSAAPLWPDIIRDARLHIFVEGGRVWLKDPLPEQVARYDLAAVGVGATLELQRYLQGGLDVAWPLRDSTVTQAHDPRLHFNLRSQF